MSIAATHGVTLDNGLTADRRLLSPDQFEMAHEVLAKAKAAGLETIRLAFVDQHGVPRGKAITVESLASVFRNGMAMTSTLLLKDTSHRTVFDVWAGDIGFGEGQLTGAGDVLIVPDPATFRILPWSPHSASILCDLYHKDGSFMPFCSRGILKRAVSALEKTGRQLVCGLEVEFYVFRIDNPRLDHADGGMPAAVPETSLLSHGFQYLTDARYDALEDVMDHLRRAAQALQLPVRSMEAEFGPSQFEFTFEPDSPLAHADAMVTFRTMVKQVCRRHGLHATFMCRPRVDNAVPSGWHLHQSLVDTATGRNLFIPADGGTVSKEASGWIGGLLAHAEESCLLTTPTVNGYKRYQPNQMAPDRVQWGKDNKGAMIRGLMAPGDKASRIENRVAEPAANPYLFFASQIYSGLDGLDRGLEAPAPVENPYKSNASALPRSLLGAVELFEKSEFYRNKLGPEFVAYLSHIKRAEWDRYLMTVSEWEQREYFSLF
ncbi:glutamine synthetase family protein [Neorhizobium alkalisoli]|uniref:Glutamine synthetase n=1 Tax=Neorhizobium alkalisoli TaxID=528178 RepID=A0A561QG78_9HYPH|nr:glutamine synthetase family protein [Neorhizobium alkalisoli]TWF49373.1 glutamine synthetase [Neorhizobium alkalisoli]